MWFRQKSHIPERGPCWATADVSPVTHLSTKCITKHHNLKHIPSLNLWIKPFLPFHKLFSTFMLRVITSPPLFCCHACPSFKGCRLERPVDAKTNTVARQLITLATDLDSVQISQISPPRLECVSFRSLETRRKQLSRGNFVKQTFKSVRQPVITHLRFTFLLIFSSQIQPKLLKAESSKSSRLRELGGATERLGKIHLSR